ncbi:DUF4189 domain-containing protein [Stenotrophomonas sp. S49]|nr:DUF4189 domain-containing protein [Stenotrophomonas sp. S49]
MAIGRGGDTGVSKGRDSKREAEEVALAQCATWGADDCKVMLAYENQCAAIATPKASNTGSSFAGGANRGECLGHCNEVLQGRGRHAV